MANLKQQIQAWSDKLMVMVNAQDMDGLAKFYSDDVVILGPAHPTICGKQGLRAYQEEMMKKFKDFTMVSKIEDVIDGGSTVTCRFSAVRKVKSTGAPAEGPGAKGIFVLIKKGSDFQVKWDAFNFDGPMPELK